MLSLKTMCRTTLTHYSVNGTAKQTITKITIRDMQNSTFGRWIAEKNWSSVLRENSSEDTFDLYVRT